MRYGLTMAGLFAVMFVGACASIGVIIPDPHSAERRSPCDRSADVLLTGKDLPEATRAGIMVRQLDCSI